MQGRRARRTGRPTRPSPQRWRPRRDFRESGLAGAGRREHACRYRGHWGYGSHWPIWWPYRRHRPARSYWGIRGNRCGWCNWSHGRRNHGGYRPPRAYWSSQWSHRGIGTDRSCRTDRSDRSCRTNRRLRGDRGRGYGSHGCGWGYGGHRTGWGYRSRGYGCHWSGWAYWSHGCLRGDRGRGYGCNWGFRCNWCGWCNRTDWSHWGYRTDWIIGSNRWGRSGHRDGHHDAAKCGYDLCQHLRKQPRNH